MRGFTKGSRVVTIKTAIELEIFSTSPASPGILSIVF